MKFWYDRIVSSNNDFPTIQECWEFYESELDNTESDTKIESGKLAEEAMRLPDLLRARMIQYHDLSAICRYQATLLDDIEGKYFKQYKETYKTSLNKTEIDKYIAHEREIIDQQIISNRFQLLKDAMNSVVEGIKAKQWKITDLRELRKAGLDEVFIREHGHKTAYVGPTS